jgi:flavodoxin
MKVLITYFSQTGNTEKVAKAVLEELSKDHDVEMKKLEETDASALSDYQAVFIGTPIHAGGLAGPTKEFLAKLPDNAGFVLAGLVTHASSAYEKENFEKGLKEFETVSREKGIACKGCFDCQGKLMEGLRPMVQKARGVADDEWAKIMAETDKHPDEQDLKNAREFAAGVVGG